MEDAITNNLLNCKKALLKYERKIKEEALGEQEKKVPKKLVDEKVSRASKNPNRTLFSPESLREHNVPGYGSQQETEEVVEEIKGLEI